VFTITTAGEAAFRHDSILGKILDAGLDADDVEREPGLTVCRMAEAHTLVWGFEAPTSDPHDVEAMKLANPASWITKAFLRRQALDPELTAAQVLQLHGCVWAAGETTFVPPDAWAARKAERVLEPGERIVLGFDGSYRRDATALVACTLDGFLAPLAVWERPERAPAEWKVPRDEVEDAIVEAMELYQVLELACDPPGWVAELDGWRELYGEVVVDYPTNQRQRMAAACDRFRVGVHEGDLSHDGSAVLARHLGHCRTKDTPYGPIVTKDAPDSPRKIDAAVAAVVAYDRAAWRASRRGRDPVRVRMSPKGWRSRATSGPNSPETHARNQATHSSESRRKPAWLLAFVADSLDASWWLDYAGGLEVPSSNLGAPIEEKTCKSGEFT
jgi:hypothetical protein